MVSLVAWGGGPCPARAGRMAHDNAEGLSLAVVFPSCLACASANGPRDFGGGGGGGATLSMQLTDLSIAQAGLRILLQSFPFQLHCQHASMKSHLKPLQRCTELSWAGYNRPAREGARMQRVCSHACMTFYEQTARERRTSGRMHA